MNDATDANNFRYTGMGIDPLSPREDWESLVKADGYTLGEKFFWTDEKGVKYTADKKLLLKAPKELDGEYTVHPGTWVICNGAFREVAANIKIILPEGLKAIGEFSLSHCKEPVELPSSVEYIGNDSLPPYQKSFTFPKMLKKITRMGIPEYAEEFFSDSPNFQVSDGFIISNNKLLKYFGKDTQVVIPNQVTTIGFGAFAFCEDLQRVVIPDSVTEIEDTAFSYCTSLHEINIPDSVKKIGRDSFAGCPGYKKSRTGGRK